MQQRAFAGGRLRLRRMERKSDEERVKPAEGGIMNVECLNKAKVLGNGGQGWRRMEAEAVCHSNLGYNFT